MSTARLVLQDAEFDELRHLISARSGIHIKGGARLSLETSLGSRLRELRIGSFDHYLRLLTTGPYQADEYEALLAHTRVFERCFFRHARQLSELRVNHLSALIRARSELRRLRVWCPGCSTGEEAYTIAILVLDTLGDGAADWHVEILGTDTGERALELAGQGVYGPSCFPAMDVRIKRRYFSTEGEGFVVVPEVRSMVCFRRHALSDALGGVRFGRWDTIFFRDLLSRLGTEARGAALELFHDRLAPDGLLVLGPDERLRDASGVFAGVCSRPGGVYTPIGEGGG